MLFDKYPKVIKSLVDDDYLYFGKEYDVIDSWSGEEDHGFYEVSVMGETGEVVYADNSEFEVIK